jgi:hypothetical protein
VSSSARSRRAVCRLLLTGALGLALAPQAAGAAPPACTTTVSTAAGATSAVADAAPGAQVCLADGTYGAIALDAAHEPPRVILTAEHPGKATVAGVTLEGSYLAVSRLRLTGQVTVGRNSIGMTVDHNLLLGQGAGSRAYGVVVCPANPPDHCDDVTITGNRFQGRFDEDAIRANVYHDGPDPDPYGLLVEGNEFAGNVEYGGHNDVFQSVWEGDHLYIRRNYLHDFGGQGILIKDQARAIDGLAIEDNLVIRQDLPCDPDDRCPTWQLSPLQVFGPIAHGSIRHNTIWPTQRGQAKAGGPVLLRDKGWSDVAVSDNVIDGGAREAATELTGTDNTRCSNVNGAWLALPGAATECSPAFIDEHDGDYRQHDGRGVTWKVSAQHFGPGAPTRARAQQPHAGHSHGWLVRALLLVAALAILALRARARSVRARRRNGVTA